MSYSDEPKDDQEESGGLLEPDLEDGKVRRVGPVSKGCSGRDARLFSAGLLLGVVLVVCTLAVSSLTPMRRAQATGVTPDTVLLDGRDDFTLDSIPIYGTDNANMAQTPPDKSKDVKDSICAQCQGLDITPTMVAKSRTNLGNVERWHRVLKKQGHIKIAVVGGSVTAGHECEPGQINVPNHACAWPHRLETMLAASSPSLRPPNQTIEVVNLAVGGTSSIAGSTLIVGLTGYDAIVMHWTANDEMEDHGSAIVAAFETDVRSALALPQRPAVLIFEGFAFQQDEPWAEEMHYDVARVYDVPVISARSAFWNHQNLGPQLRLQSLHVESEWHARFACLMYENWVQESQSPYDMTEYNYDVDHKPVFGGETLKCNTTSSATAISETLEGSPSLADGWSYYADVPGKYGYIANTSGSVLEFNLHPNQKRNVFVLQYLHSYTDEWGNARVDFSIGSFEDGLRKVKLKAQQKTNHVSQTAQKFFHLPHSEETVTVTITSLGGKFKVLGYMMLSCEGQT